jgi:potassium-transporting ATPase KdpC subunit
MKTYVFPSLRLLFVLTILTGILYPIFMTLIARFLFPYQTQGSLIENNGKIIGSELIGQQFVSDKYFWSRPSAIDYNTLPSSGSNFGPTSRAMTDSMNARKIRFIKQNLLSPNTNVPQEMFFASACGLDPDISPGAVLLQVTRIVHARVLDSTGVLQINNLVQQFTESPQWNILGQERVNVLKLNLALDRELSPIINNNNGYAVSLIKK